MAPNQLAIARGGQLVSSSVVTTAAMAKCLEGMEHMTSALDCSTFSHNTRVLIKFIANIPSYIFRKQLLPQLIRKDV